MNIEELKLILNTVQGVADEALGLAIVYVVGSFLSSLLKCGIVGYAIYKATQLVIVSISSEDKFREKLKLMENEKRNLTYKILDLERQNEKK